jgi:hypothetical protein
MKAIVTLIVLSAILTNQACADTPKTTQPSREPRPTGNKPSDLEPIPGKSEPTPHQTDWDTGSGDSRHGSDNPDDRGSDTKQDHGPAYKVAAEIAAGGTGAAAISAKLIRDRAQHRVLPRAPAQLAGISRRGLVRAGVLGLGGAASAATFASDLKDAVTSKAVPTKSLGQVLKEEESVTGAATSTSRTD